MGALEKKKAGAGERVLYKGGYSLQFWKGGREGPFEETFESRPEGDEGSPHADS